jgi:hypothetical protein
VENAASSQNDWAKGSHRGVYLVRSTHHKRLLPSRHLVGLLLFSLPCSINRYSCGDVFSSTYSHTHKAQHCGSHRAVSRRELCKRTLKHVLAERVCESQQSSQCYIVASTQVHQPHTHSTISEPRIGRLNTHTTQHVQTIHSHLHLPSRLPLLRASMEYALRASAPG